MSDVSPDDIHMLDKSDSEDSDFGDYDSPETHPKPSERTIPSYSVASIMGYTSDSLKLEEQKSLSSGTD